GMTAVVDRDQVVKGIFTDGDLRRVIAKGTDLRVTPIRDIMSANPRTIGPDHLAAEAAEIMERGKVTQLLVVDDGGRLLGALNIHD
ncbi:CBS domain-containing protein, partial [Pseudomonas aeruginosa]|uniref:CBS domain-containing protein n=1 Tax=Pseudomonas aeruginosa TaxID=287 RepID=UPI003CC5639F